MTDLDRLRWFWVGNLAQDIADWAGAAWRFTESVPTPAGVGFPLASAVAISRTARQVVDSDSYDQILGDLERTQVADGIFDGPRERASAVAEALSGGNWPSSLPLDPAEAEHFFTEAWAAARSFQGTPDEVRRELVDRWAVVDPRMLDYLCSLDPTPFEVYVDLLTRVVDLPDEDLTKTILANLRWQTEQDPHHLAAVERLADLPAHLQEVAEDLTYVMRLDRKLERLCQASLDQAPDRHEGFADARRVVVEQRSALVALMESFTSHEVDLVRDALNLPQPAQSERFLTVSTRSPTVRLPSPSDEATASPSTTEAPQIRRDLDPIAVSVRLRRLWTDELGPWLEGIDNDLGSVWRDTLLRRIGLTLDVISPISFGQGDPFGDIRGDIVDLLSGATNGQVNRVRVSFLGDANYKPARRAKTTDLDVFDPGDAEAIRETIASELSGRLSPKLEREAREALSALRLSGASRHRMWLVTSTAQEATAVAKTPGAAHALWDAVRRPQRVAQDPLYAVYSDHQVWAESPRIAIE